ncbi:ABC transporter substrate-binding protein [Euzebya tangerina]|uniref:ABC transporter substrate-binding protein n=1 Tax=Euzebya tangerina TaxID=591198 RepID=UPI000E30ED2F|nr:ABC transporter substrate-binding protein [Euzebya tangerina]
MTNTTRSPRRLVTLLLMLALALVAGACAADDADDGTDAADSTEDVPATEDQTMVDDEETDGSDDGTDEPDDAAAAGEDLGELVVGSTNFDEQELVAEMYALSLEQAGFTVERRYQLGAREVVLPALTSGEINVYPEYVGTALEFLNGGAGEASSDTEATTELLREEFAEEGVDVLEPAEAQDKNGLVVRPETADELGLETVSDLADEAGDLTLGGPPECPERPLCIPGYEETYGITFGDFRSLDAGGPVTVEALSSGEIDVALLFTTDAVISANEWVLLEDDQGLQPAENIVPVIQTEVNNEAATEALNAVSAVLTTENVSEMLGQIRIDLADPAEVASEFLTEQGVLDG